MKTLAIECATEACSAALFNGSSLLDGRYEVLGRGHAERLVPMIAELPDKGRADRILVSLGPGSFTGVRIGLATARALGLAWGAEVLGYPTLSLVAARTWQPTPRPVTVCMNGGHGEWFVQNFANGTQVDGEVRSLAPEEAARFAQHKVIAGNRANELAELIGGDTMALNMLPDARKAYMLHETRLTTGLTPIYGRAPDAKKPGES
ncbi:tRNA (adenosine(37)-N6)-threonylcarbamoyltransferase complex dimerization subunit type 1 TsaB [Aurantiacibacter sp. D1-12]|uniref:tRNA (adenosine(37)-N6)-threonylcarbamoyltransferase complex dimerization subunit type 1 TsaB n=1 Tax=Aurantiacibacter sp. D1-12 TaxID=2993658 RepID=UPI00237C8020|nr:tRNA (adenosine(37)-N6)-threonylcarbamoyltransferase complex dimerization subunit type 1 TsaB [Aurantiacibacter sp. D1-12]MDE1467919.1 tRNA (adenosine(37)-N6)-threonylcarbamoyltransferase complex dimerization subunit type 1 TsaB [Aurantiacibacter sp. D1-12]